jgi:hypothetical protein
LLVVICLFSPKNQQTDHELKSNRAVVQAKKAKKSKFSRVFLFLDGSGWQLGAKDFGRPTA